MGSPDISSNDPQGKRPAATPSYVSPTPNEIGGTILVVDDEPDIRHLLATVLRRAGYDVTLASNGVDALACLTVAIPDLIIADVMMPDMDGFDLVTRLRATTATRAVPLIFLSARSELDDRIAGLLLGADDYLTKPFDMGELLARVRVKIERPPIPSDQLPRDRQTGLLSERLLRDEVSREISRAQRTGRLGCLAILDLAELAMLRARLGARAIADVAKQVTALVAASAEPLDLTGRDTQGHFVLALPETDPASAQRRLETLSGSIAAHVFVGGGERLRLTPVIGFAPFATGVAYDQLRSQGRLALSQAASRLDLRPVCFEPAMERIAPLRPRASWLTRLFFPAQVALTLILSLVVPFFGYATLDALGHDLTPLMYVVVVAALLVTASLIWIEGLFALRNAHPSDPPQQPYPAASAIIAAYLPNEAATVVETIEAFLRMRYPAPLQIILAYNTPRDLPIEGTLRDIASRDPRLLPLRVDGSTSKAQNVNAALAEVTGEIVGVFDADHQPEPDSFCRAWRWLADGYDVVQGHCVVRNGDESWVARTVAVEFESIYAVSHPGRTRLHGFGIFGGSNGYWRTDLLRQTRMRGFMLTEDIDSSMRAIEDGYRIVSDPYLLSRELATVTLKSFWNQRMRWAQGWFQVSMQHLGPGFRSRHLGLRQKIGLFYLLGWREIYPWLSVQMFPIVAYWGWKYGGLDHLDWVVPIFVVTSLFTLTAGPGQTVLAYLKAAPEIRRRKRWFVSYLLVSIFFFTELKNTIARVSQVKELMGERQWKVTPRTTAGTD